MELYSASMERQARLMKTVAAALGADVSSDEMNDYANASYNINSPTDLGVLPINVGYATME